MSEDQAPAKRTASQRLDDLEAALNYTFQTLEQMARENGVMKEAIQLLGAKLDAIVKASETNQPLSDANLSSIMVQERIANLESKVSNLRDQGILVAEDVVSPTSFIVGRELSATGEVVNPRLQFAVASVQDETTKGAFPGAKVGDVLNLGEGKLSFEILETYSIQQPSAQPEPQVEA